MPDNFLREIHSSLSWPILLKYALCISFTVRLQPIHIPFSLIVHMPIQGGSILEGMLYLLQGSASKGRSVFEPPLPFWAFWVCCYRSVQYKSKPLWSWMPLVIVVPSAELSALSPTQLLELLHPLIPCTVRISITPIQKLLHLHIISILH